LRIRLGEDKGLHPFEFKCDCIIYN
jgi:hypothetical protein